MNMLEQETMTAIKSACRKYMNEEKNNEINWDERRFQLINNMMPIIYEKFYSLGNEAVAKKTIELCDEAINQLKK